MLLMVLSEALVVFLLVLGSLEGVENSTFVIFQHIWGIQNFLYTEIMSVILAIEHT